METKIQACIQNTHELIGMSPDLEIVSISENYPQLYTFLPRTTIHWNALPYNIPILPTLAQFSTAVCQHFLAFIMYVGLVGVREINYTITPTIIADLFSHDNPTKMLMIFYFTIPVGRTFAAYSYVATPLKKFVDYYKQKDGTMFINEVHME